jgi:hypothetical protein
MNADKGARLWLRLRLAQNMLANVESAATVRTGDAGRENRDDIFLGWQGIS